MKSILKFILNSIRTAVSNIQSNQQVFLVSVTTIAIAMSILGLFLVVFVNLESFLSSWSRQVQLIVYLKDDITQKQRQDIESLIKKNPEVDSFYYISRESAWEEFKSTFSGKADFLKELDFNPLPASYSLKFASSLDHMENIRKIARVLTGRPGVESLEYGEKWIARFEKFMIFLRVFLFAAGGLLSLGLILIISNTIKLSIYSRQEEIEVMLLIGATRRFVVVPFLFEGMVQGFAGALIAIGFLKSLHLYIQSQFEGSITSLARGLDFQFISVPFIMAMVIMSILIGWVGSYLSISQFLQSGSSK